MSPKLVSLCFATVMFAMIYKSPARARVDGADVWIGATVATMLFPTYAVA